MSRLGDVAIARLSIEPACAALAAELPDRQGIVDELTRLVNKSESIRSPEDFKEATQDFHWRLVELCGNTTMVILAGTLESIWNAQDARAALIDVPDRANSRLRAIGAHRRIAAAIAAGNSHRASGEMRRHLADSQRLMISSYDSDVIELATPLVARGGMAPGR